MIAFNVAIILFCDIENLFEGINFVSDYRVQKFQITEVVFCTNIGLVGIQVSNCYNNIVQAEGNIRNVKIRDKKPVKKVSNETREATYSYTCRCITPFILHCVYNKIMAAGPWTHACTISRVRRVPTYHGIDNYLFALQCKY